MANQKTYVKVVSDFDRTGYMQPRSITWADGRVFKIDAVQEIRPASTFIQGLSGDCYTVLICGKWKHLFFERLNPRYSPNIGRWFVETAQ